MRQALDAGAAVVTFSGDKLLGGPQAGVVARARRPRRAPSPGIRWPAAVRADKLTLAALQQVALAYLARGRDDDPAVADGHDPARRAGRAGRGGSPTRSPGAKVVDTEAVAGGGSLPGLTIPSVGVAVEVSGARRGRSLRCRAAASSPASTTAAIVCDLRTVDPRRRRAARRSRSPLRDAR